MLSFTFYRGGSEKLGDLPVVKQLVERSLWLETWVLFQYTLINRDITDVVLIKKQKQNTKQQGLHDSFY